MHESVTTRGVNVRRRILEGSESKLIRKKAVKKGQQTKTSDNSCATERTLMTVNQFINPFSPNKKIL